jgi:hypothetical protein
MKGMRRVRVCYAQPEVIFQGLRASDRHRVQVSHFLCAKNSRTNEAQQKIAGEPSQELLHEYNKYRDRYRLENRDRLAELGVPIKNVREVRYTPQDTRNQKER